MTPRSWAVPGAMVVCVADDWSAHARKMGIVVPVRDTVYTVRSTRDRACACGSDDVYVVLEEIRNDPRACPRAGCPVSGLEPAFACVMFRPVRATDIGDLLALQSPKGGEPVTRREREMERTR